MSVHERSPAGVPKEYGGPEAWQHLQRRLAKCLEGLQRSRIRLLLELDDTLRILGIDLRDEQLYTGNMQTDVMVRTRLCTDVFRERIRESRRRLAKRKADGDPGRM